MDLHLENGKNTAIAAGMDPVARVDAAVAAMANGAVAPSDPRQDTACAEQLRSFDAVMALPDDDRLLARLLIRKVQQRVDGFGRVLRMAGAVEHGTDIVKLLGDPARLKAALVWETAQYDLVSRNRALVPSGKPKRKGRRLRESQLAKLPRDGRYSDQANCLHLHVTPAGTRRWIARVTLDFLPYKIRVEKRPDGTEEKKLEPERVDVRLGMWPAVSLAQARERALERCRLVADGKDPRVTAAASTRTLGKAWEEALPKRAKAQQWKGGLTGKSAKGYKGAFDNHVGPVLGSVPVVAITPQGNREAGGSICVDRRTTPDIPVAGHEEVLNIVIRSCGSRGAAGGATIPVAAAVAKSWVSIEGYDGGIRVASSGLRLRRLPN